MLPPPRCLNCKGADQLGAGESADLLRGKRHDLWRHHLARARRAHRSMNRDVPDEKEPREAPKILVTAFYARSGPSRAAECGLKIS